jgi:LmbE family N-acetylglucosaminyl deacetylase
VITCDEVAELGTILGIWAHPDDEAYLSGGLMALARENGQRVVCVTATRGERGTSDPVVWPPDRLAAERTRELSRCLSILGVREHRWLDYFDGGCARIDPDAAASRLAAVIDEVRPDTVLTFGPDGITGHADHRAVGAWATDAVERAASAQVRLLHAAIPAQQATRWGPLTQRLGVYEPGYPLVTADERLAVSLALPRDIAVRKVRALAAQATQTAGLIATLGVDLYTAWVGEEAFVEAARVTAVC